MLLKVVNNIYPRRLIVEEKQHAQTWIIHNYCFDLFDAISLRQLGLETDVTYKIIDYFPIFSANIKVHQARGFNKAEAHMLTQLYWPDKYRSFIHASWIFSIRR